MSTPQQPELHRSKLTPEMDRDVMTARLDARDQPGNEDRAGAPVPAANTPGTAGPTPDDQDQPDLDKFAAKLGVQSNAGSDSQASDDEDASLLNRLTDKVLRPTDVDRERLREQREEMVRSTRTATAGLLNRAANVMMSASKSLEQAADKVAVDQDAIDLREDADGAGE